MENRLLSQFNGVITSQWLSKHIEEPYGSLIPRELFENIFFRYNYFYLNDLFENHRVTQRIHRVFY